MSIAPQTGQETGVATVWAKIPARALLFEATLMATLMFAYRWVRHLADGNIDHALRNANSVWHVERLFAFPSEAKLQSWVFDHFDRFDVAKFANWYYVGAHFPITAAMLVWLFIWHRHAYRRIRIELILLTAMALIVHVLYPLAPPRLSPHLNMIDTMNSVGPSAYPPGNTGIANQFAAMPSLHIGWAVVVAIAVCRVVKGWPRWVIWLHPLATTFVVVVTANHYWLDGVVAIGLLVIAMGMVSGYYAFRRRAANKMIVDHTDSLHKSVNGGGTDETKPEALQVARESR